MSYLSDLHRAHKQRLIRLSSRLPEAGPLVSKPQPRTILFDKAGRRIVPVLPPPPAPRPPQYPSLPPLTAEVANSVTIGRVMFAVAEAYNLPNIAALKNHRRKADVVRPRQVAMYLAREMAGGSYPMIARLFGHFDHTTCMHAVKVVPEKMQIDPTLAAKVEEIKQKLTCLSGCRTQGLENGRSYFNR